MPEPITKTDLDKAKEKARLIAAYHRAFETTEGKLVLEDLRRAFGTSYPAFRADAQGRFDPIHAAIRDGQRQVLLHIELILSNTEPEGDGNAEAPEVSVITEQNL